RTLVCHRFDVPAVWPHRLSACLESRISGSADRKPAWIRHDRDGLHPSGDRWVLAQEIRRDHILIPMSPIIVLAASCIALAAGIAAWLAVTAINPERKLALTNLRRSGVTLVTVDEDDGGALGAKLAAWARK